MLHLCVATLIFLCLSIILVAKNISREFSKCEQFTFKLNGFVNAMFSFTIKSNTGIYSSTRCSRNELHSDQTEQLTKELHSDPLLYA